MAWVAAAALFVGCGDDGAKSESTQTSSGGTTADTSGSGSTSVTTTSSSATSADTSSGPTTGPGDTSTSSATDDTGPGGETPADYCGQILFAEPFEDTDFESRDWYDGPSATLSTDEYVEGASSFECQFNQGATGCAGGTPGRHLFDGQTAVCLSYWVKYSANWVGSGQPYHPHEFHFITNEDDIYVGPANTHLTTYTEQVGGVPRLAIQDSRNVDLDCVLLNNDSFVGCNGDFDSYMFTEDRSAASCNGLLGDLDGRDCFSTGNGYYSARFWDADIQAFGDAPPWDKNEWQHVVSYWKLNDIEDGIGVPNGVLRYWVDGELLIAYDQILMRTGAHPDMVFNQFLIATYIGDGSPIDQTVWVDDLEVSAGL